MQGSVIFKASAMTDPPQSLLEVSLLPRTDGNWQSIGAGKPEPQVSGVRAANALSEQEEVPGFTGALRLIPWLPDGGAAQMRCVQVCP